MVAVIKMGAYIHGVLILCGYLLSQFYGNQIKLYAIVSAAVQFVCMFVMAGSK